MLFLRVVSDDLGTRATDKPLTCLCLRLGVKLGTHHVIPLDLELLHITILAGTLGRNLLALLCNSKMKTSKKALLPSLTSFRFFAFF